MMGCAKLLLMVACLVAPHASAAPGAAPPPAVQYVEHPGAMLPVETLVRDEGNHAMRLGALLHGRPGIVVLGYYGCSNLCSVLIEALARGLSRARMLVGRDVEVLVLSIDPLETPELARRRKATLLSQADDDVRAGWHFLTADAPSVERITHAAGFQYAYDSESAQYAHPGGVMLVTPAGQISSYVSGVAFEAGALRESVARASQASIAASAAQRWLQCFHYDPRTGRYTPIVTEIVRVVALLVALLLAAWMLHERKRGRRNIA
ncbi:MAG: SCO family protein [Pseudomonadota bacterium]|nr:SCO family protein [Pseudomonadota bacterium]